MFIVGETVRVNFAVNLKNSFKNDANREKKGRSIKSDRLKNKLVYRKPNQTEHHAPHKDGDQF